MRKNIKNILLANIAMSRSIYTSVLVKPILVLFSYSCICFVVSCNGVGDSLNMKQKQENPLVENKKFSSNVMPKGMKQCKQSKFFSNIQKESFDNFMLCGDENNIAFSFSSLTKFLTNSEYDEIASTLKSPKKDLYLSLPNFIKDFEDKYNSKKTFEDDLSMIIKENSENLENLKSLEIIGGHNKGFSLRLTLGISFILIMFHFVGLNS